MNCLIDQTCVVTGWRWRSAAVVIFNRSATSRMLVVYHAKKEIIKLLQLCQFFSNPFMLFKFDT